MTRLLLCHQPTDGGVGRHVEDLVLGLGERGYEVLLCGPAVPKGLAGKVAHAHLDLGRAIAPRADVAAVAGLGRIVREHRPDLIHAHSSKAGAVARLARPLQPRTPLIYTPHGYAFAGYFSRSGERLAYRGIEQALAPLASRVVCVCEAEARLARSIGPKNRVRVVHNGVEPVQDGPVDRRVAELSRRGPVIGALAQLRPGKGLETLIDAFPRMLTRHPTAQLAIVGDGPDLQKLRAHTELRGTADAVHFLGSSSDPQAVLRGLEVFVHPSWAEAFPYVILEAMSLGRPIVASDVGGIGEAVVDGASGFLVRPRDDGALAEALLEMLDDPIRRTRMGAMALSRVRECFTRAAMIGRLIDVYDELMQAPLEPDVVEDPGSEVASSPSSQAMTRHLAR
ncbi:MAG TPA: glycosyltransferase family 4 protein [Solirubrobacteraceae bacterium]|nr:glycosyltransferase family 4 protein [Solirubrobacteraceae bacterium]